MVRLSLLLTHLASLLVLALGAPAVLHAEVKYYQIQWDCFNTGPNCKTTFGRYRSFGSAFLDTGSGNLVGWPTVGAGGMGPPTGSRLLNRTGEAIIGFRMVVDEQVHPDARFAVDEKSGGHLFAKGEIWRRKNHKEVLFKGTNIPDNTYIWSVVFPRGPHYPRNDFLGSALTYDYVIPDLDNWERIYPRKPAADGDRVMRDAISACPFYLRDWSAVAKIQNEKLLFFMAADELYVFDASRKTITRCDEDIELPAGINGITIEKKKEREEVVLLKGGREVGRVSAEAKTGKVIGKVPRSIRPKAAK